MRAWQAVDPARGLTTSGCGEKAIVHGPAPGDAAPVAPRTAAGGQTVSRLVMTRQRCHHVDR